MKTNLLIFITCLFTTFLNAQKTYIPDDNFEQKLIQLGYDSGPLDDSVLTANIIDIIILEIPHSNIEDLTGIEDFESLKSLECNHNKLTTLDITSNIELLVLYCSNNELTTLNTSNNPYLRTMRCDSNQLTSLYVANNSILKTLACSYNQLTSLNVSNNTALEWLQAYDNQITSIDLSNNPALELFGFGNNLLTSLDVSNNHSIWHLNCRNNQLTHLDASNVTSLESFICDGNSLETIQVANGNNTNMIRFKADNNPNLLCIEVDNQTYSTANWISGTQNFSFNNMTPPFSEDCASTIGLDDVEAQNSLSVYPMPATNVLNIDLEYRASYTIYSMLGKHHISGNLQEGNNTVNVSDIQSGMYMLNVTSKDGITVNQLLNIK